MELKKGMYVRCNIDEDNENGRVFIIGQISEIDYDTEQVRVEFHDIMNINIYFESIPKAREFYGKDVKRCRILDETMVILDELSAARIITSCGQDGNGYYQYYVETIGKDKKILKVSENQILAQYTRGEYSPINQMLNYEFHNPLWYKSRSIVSSAVNVLKNSSYGFELLVGSRVYLLPHQIDTIVRAISEDSCRLMLADEVGLGKTIEACVIMKGLKKRKHKFKTLIITPKPLVKQWQNELSYKFWLDVPVFGEVFDYKRENDLIMSLDDLISEKGQAVAEQEWDLCIIDETHRLVNNRNQYNAILSLSKKTQNILLLSATPIQQRRTEYLNLLRLLDPIKYETMEENDFEKLINKSKYIKDSIHELVKDLNYYIEDELAEDYIEQLEEVNEELEDEVLAKLITMIDYDSEDQGLEIVKVILAYISKHYEIEKNIIRHRRLELSDKMVRRTYELINYSMSGSDESFYETDTYNSLIEYLSCFDSMHGKRESSLIGQFKKLLLSAMFSSPWALISILKERSSFLKGKSKLQLEEYKALLSSIPCFTGESDMLEDIIVNCRKWLKACEFELERANELIEDPELIKGRLIYIVDYLDQNFTDEKIVLFTQWTETAMKLEELLIKIFGESSVATFYQGKSIEELEFAVDRFQGDNKCRFMICDKLGGEGRNFQMADAVVHVDLPWSPVDLEQRIGRLDRIGRDVSKEVLSVIFVSQETAEEDLFNLWNKGLNIFNESLSGLEIALGDVERNILESLSEDIKYGLKYALERIIESSSRMRSEVDKERYFDLAKQLDTDEEKRLAKLVRKFDENGGRILYNSMDSWAKMTGLHAKSSSIIDKEGNINSIVTYSPSGFSMGSLRNTLFCPPNTREALKRAKGRNELRGTFSRDIAVKREDLIFFSPGEEIFDSIVTNAMETSRGRSCAFAIKSDIEWAGLVYTWNVNFGVKSLIENNVDLANVNKIQGYLPLDQIITFHALNKKYDSIDKYLVQDRLQAWKEESLDNSKKNTAHLGQRGRDKDFLGFRKNYPSNLIWFKEKFPRKIWSNIVKTSYDKSINEVREKLSVLINIDKVQPQFDRIISANKASNIYFNKGEIAIRENKQLELEFEAIIKGLKKPKVTLDSVAFIWMVKK